MRPFPLFFGVAFVGLVLGCAGPAGDADDEDDPLFDGDADADADSDADADADADADSDTDADTDADVCEDTTSICAAGECTLDLDERVFAVSGAVTYNGATPPDYYGSANADYVVRFTDVTSAQTYAFSGSLGTWSGGVPGGTYDVSVELNDDGTSGYCYDPVRVYSDKLVSADTTLDLAVRVHDVHGDVTYNGATPPDYYGSANDDYVVRFTDTDSGQVYAFSDAAGTYAGGVPGGTYDVTVELNDDGTSGYCYDPVLVASAQRISADTTLDLDERVFDVGGSVTSRRTAPPDYYGSANDDYVVRFTDVDSGQTYAFSDASGTWSGGVPGGTYDVSVELNDPGTSGYCYDPVRVLSDQVVSADATLNLPVRVHDVQGAVTYNGATPPDYYGSANDDYVVRFTDTDSGQVYAFSDAAGSYAGGVPSGTYDVSVELNDDGTSGYCYDPVLVAAYQRISADTTLDLDERVFEVQGDVTYNGDTPPDYYGSANPDYVVRFVETNTGQTFAFSGALGTYAGGVPSGVYDVSVELNDPGTSGYCYDPVDVILGRVVTADATVDLAVEVYDVSGSVTYNGDTPPDYYGSANPDYVVRFTDIESSQTFSFSGSLGTYAGGLPAGVYDASIELNDDGTSGYCYDPVIVATCVEVGPS